MRACVLCVCVCVVCVGCGCSLGGRAGVITPQRISKGRGRERVSCGVGSIEITEYICVFFGCQAVGVRSLSSFVVAVRQIMRVV